MVDLGADTSFAAAVEKVREHYGVAVSSSAVRVVTQEHGAALWVEPEVDVRLPREGVAELIAEIDGMLLPMVEVGEALRGASGGSGRLDGRRRNCVWPDRRKRCGGAMQRRWAVSSKPGGTGRRVWRRRVRGSTPILSLIHI